MNGQLKSFSLRRQDFSVFGSGLTRPECVRADHDGVRIHANGRTEIVLEKFAGKPPGTVNTAWADKNERIWVSVMTRFERWHQALNTEPDGCVLLIEDGNTRIVADGLHLTNEIKVHPNGRYLYGVETLGKRVFRFPIEPSGDLGVKEIFGPEDSGHGAFPDGFTFDEEGNVWVTIVSRNGLTVISEDGDQHTIYEEPKLDAVNVLVKAMQAKTATVEHFIACTGETLALPTSLAFGGPDRRTAYVGTLALPHLLSVRSPVAGLTLG